MRRIPSLDGWRGIAILLVLITHYQSAFLGKLRWNSGQHGVQIFFVLSGYLITQQLLSTKRIHLRAFYLRRAFRILPAAFFYLAVLSLLTLIVAPEIQGTGIVASLLFFRNYLPQTNANLFTNQFWTLSVEEQFYLAWPATLLLLGKRRAAGVAAILCAATAGWRMAFWAHYAVIPHFQDTEIRADGLLIGCLLAIALSEPPIKRWASEWARSVFWLAFPIFAVDCTIFGYILPLHESIVIAAMIGSTSISPDFFLSRMLDWTPLATVGVLSYSIYLWQQLFLHPFWGPLWPALLGASVLFSYAIIENPTRRLGRKIASRIFQPEMPSSLSLSRSSPDPS